MGLLENRRALVQAVDAHPFLFPHKVTEAVMLIRHKEVSRDHGFIVVTLANGYSARSGCGRYKFAMKTIARLLLEIEGTYSPDHGGSNGQRQDNLVPRRPRRPN